MHEQNTWRRRLLALSACIPLLLASSPILFAQEAGLPAGLTIRMVGVKNRPAAGASDRVSDFAMRALECTNTNGAPIATWIGPYVIRAGKRFQPEYLDSTFVQVPPRSTVTLPVEVYCLDAGSPVAPPRSRFGGSDRWTKVNTARTPLTAADLAGQPGVTPVSYPPGAKSVPTFPGTDAAFGYRIDPNVNFDLFVRYAHELIEAVDGALAQTAVQTVLDNKPQTERHVVTQVLIWQAIGTVTGEGFKVTDLEKNIQNAYTGGDRKKAIPAGVQSQLSSGAINIWNNVNLVGADAKVLTR